MTEIFNGGIETSAGTYGENDTGVPGFGKVSALTVQWNFDYGSGGTTVDGYLQTSIDGVNWYDIATARFATGSETTYQAIVMSGVSTPVALTQAGLTQDTVIHGFIGSMFRVVRKVAGTYAGSTLACHIAPKT